MAVLEIKDLVAGYGERLLLRNLSFFVPAPTFIAIIGHNGSGKSTFLKALTGQIPSQGQVLVQGQPLPHRPGALARAFSYLPQKNNVAFPVTVLELVVMGLFRSKRLLDHYTAQDYSRAEDVLSRLGVHHLRHRTFTDLSGGEQQLVWLAQLMLQDSPVALLDEPTQQLDVYHKKRVFDLMASWVQQEQKTVLCITHDLLNLLPLQGCLLNLSQPHPQLEALSPETVLSHQKFLEEKPQH
ncbi:ABC transporter ATP-binding protein [Rufibacter quisquiliarum]|uniref:Iron complex transport system ATP-binding protein n=1 Tax=Rufibacter quisquiliarum TaxID=1549639 RepID=A0A839GZZ2_9BACT|nr:ABC transporter ATP-binding protein [Rufibacter quisquiliarum]MBA9079251.1 iron complex transport system ATP-binding protein [Rufibacter quisquiliarum]